MNEEPKEAKTVPELEAIANREKADFKVCEDLGPIDVIQTPFKTGLNWFLAPRLAGSGALACIAGLEKLRKKLAARYSIRRG